jgi:hypothetical protein
MELRRLSYDLNSICARSFGRKQATVDRTTSGIEQVGYHHLGIGVKPLGGGLIAVQSLLQHDGAISLG